MLIPRSFSASSFLKYLLIAVLVLGSGAGDAYAKTKTAAKKEAAPSDVAQSKNGWQVGMIKGEKGDFSYCLMRAEFNNDLSFAVALSPKQEINLGIGVPKAGFTKDEKHQMKVSVGSYSKDAVAIAANPELLLIPMHEDKPLMNALRSGKVIVLTGKADETKFGLKNMDKALAGLQECVDVGTGKKPMPKEAAAPAGKDAAGAKGKGKTAVFPPSLKALLLKAGLKDMEIVDITDPKKAPVDFGWRTNGLFGGMRERPVPAEATIEKMTELMEGGYKKQCTGTFTATKGDVENYPGIQMRTMNVGCDMKERNAYVALFIYLTDNHLFTMFMHEGDGANKENANKARDQVATLLRAIAKEPAPAPAKGAAPATPAPAASAPAAPAPAAATP